MSFQNRKRNVLSFLNFALHREKLGDESLKMYRKSSYTTFMFMKFQGVIRHFHAEIVNWESERGCKTRCSLATRDAATIECVLVSSLYHDVIRLEGAFRRNISKLPF